jgi:hypothetical protein
MSQVPTFEPNVWRILLGFVLAPLVAALAFSLIHLDVHLGELDAILLVLIYGALPATIIFGIPVFVLLYRSVQPHIVTIAVIGGVVAVLPWLLLMQVPGAEHAELGDCVTIENGRTTWCGFLSNMKLLSVIFIYGAFGGLVFWFCAVWRSVQSKEFDSQTD